MLERDEARREEAAQPSRLRIRQDRAMATRSVQSLLTYIDNHLFDPDFSVQKMKRDLGLKGNQFLTRFHAEVGQPPFAYLASRRMETAARLLRDTSYRIWKVGLLVGYQQISTFSRCFLRWSDLRPTEYRKRHRTELPVQEVKEQIDQLAEGPKQPTTESLIREIWSLQKALSSSVDPTTEPSLPVVVEGRLFERFIAEQAGNLLPELSRREQTRLVRESLCFSTPELFDLLRSKSTTEGRKDRALGVLYAELAFESLQGSASALGEALPILRAQAWACIGKAHWLALDFLAAEQALDKASRELPTAHSDPRTQAEILQIRAGLRWSQRRYEEAMELINSAVPILREHSDTRPLAQALILRSNIVRHARDPRTAFTDLEEAWAILAELEDSCLEAAAWSSQLRLDLLLADSSRASETLRRADAYISKTRDPMQISHMRWLEGLLHLEMGDLERAEGSLQDARCSFVELGDTANATGATLDLAFVLAEQGRHNETTPLLAEALPVFEAFQINRDIFAGLKLLRNAIDAGAASRDILVQLRRLTFEHLLGH